MPLSAEPEILRCTLTSSILQLKCLNQDLETLDFMDKPDTDSCMCIIPGETLCLTIPSLVMSALTTLYLLGAIDDTKALTELGRKMALLPLEPQLARALMASVEFGCTLEVLTIVSVLSTSSKLYVDNTDSREAATEARRKFRHPSGDHLTVLNIVKSYEEMQQSQGKSGRKEWCKKQLLNERCLLEALDIRKQLTTSCERLGIDWKVSCGEAEQPVLKSLLRGLVHQAAFLQPDGSYKQIMGPSVRSLIKHSNEFYTLLTIFHPDRQNSPRVFFVRQESPCHHLR